MMSRCLTIQGRAPLVAAKACAWRMPRSAVVPVEDVSERPGEVVTGHLDPRDLLSYLAVERSSFVLRFPPGKGHAMACEGEGLSFLVMPMSRD